MRASLVRFIQFAIISDGEVSTYLSFSAELPEPENHLNERIAFRLYLRDGMLAIRVSHNSGWSTTKL